MAYWNLSFFALAYHSLAQTDDSQFQRLVVLRRVLDRVLPEKGLSWDSFDHAREEELADEHLLFGDFDAALQAYRALSSAYPAFARLASAPA